MNQGKSCTTLLMNRSHNLSSLPLLVSRRGKEERLAIQRELTKLHPPSLPGGVGGQPRVIMLRCCTASYISEGMTNLFPHS